VRQRLKLFGVGLWSSPTPGRAKIPSLARDESLCWLSMRRSGSPISNLRLNLNAGTNYRPTRSRVTSNSQVSRRERFDVSVLIRCLNPVTNLAGSMRRRPRSRVTYKRFQRVGQYTEMTFRGLTLPISCFYRRTIFADNAVARATLLSLTRCANGYTLSQRMLSPFQRDHDNSFEFTSQHQPREAFCDLTIPHKGFQSRQYFSVLPQ
jgi:hypothetical protein